MIPAVTRSFIQLDRFIHYLDPSFLAARQLQLIS